MKGSLQIKNETYYVVFYENCGGVKKQKWISTKLKVGVDKVFLMQKYNEIMLKNSFFDKKFNKNVPNLNFGEFYAIWLNIKEKQVQPTTFANLCKYGKKIVPYFKSKQLMINDIKPIDIENFYSHLFENGMCNNTVKQYHITLKQVFSYLIKNDWILFNPMLKVDKPKETKTNASFYTKQDMQKLFECLINEEIKLPIMLAGMYGLRRSEVLGLKWSAIDFENKQIYVNHKVVEVFLNGNSSLYKSNAMKTSSSNRILPLFPQAEAILLQAKSQQENNKRFLKSHYNKKDYDYVCVDNKGDLIKPSRLSHGFLKILKKNNLRHIRFHDLRHSCASIMLAQKVSMKQIQEWLGHSNFSTTANIYSHLDFESKKNSAYSVSKAYSFLNSEFDILSNDYQQDLENISEVEIVEIIEKYKKMLKKLKKTQKMRNFLTKS